MRVSPLIFLAFALALFGGAALVNALESCDRSRDRSPPASRATKASVMRRSVLPIAWLGLLCRHRSEQCFTGVDAALVVCDFRVPLVECHELMLRLKYSISTQNGNIPL